MPMSAAFDAFVAPARHRPQLWRLLLGCVLMTAVALLWIGATFGALAAIGGGERAGELLSEILTPDGPAGALLLLSTFGGMALGPALAVRLLHGRSAASLLGPRGRLVRDFGVAFGVVCLLYGLSLLFWTSGFDPRANLESSLWLRLLPFSLLLLLVQTGAEEAIFRGYLQQQLAARLPYPAIYILVPSIAFGALHFDPETMGAANWVVVFSAIVFGVAAADLTRVTGSLGAAWGLHFANNAFAVLLLATDGTITGLALYVTPYEVSDAALTVPLILADLVTLLAVWGGLRWALAR